MSISHYNHTIYEEGIKKLKAAGLDKRIPRVLKSEIEEDTDDSLCMYLGFGLDREDYVSILGDELKNRGFLKENLDFRESFYEQRFSPNEKLSKIKEAIRDYDNRFWQIKKDGKIVNENSCLGDDFQLFSGYYASYVLNPEEFWGDPERFGFSSTSDLWGVIGTRMKQKNRGYMKRGHKWKSENDGKQFITEVTGSEHGDFRLFRTDITSYETFDPLGNRVNYRPELDSDRKMVCAYHSVEPVLLALIIKWIDQEDIDSEILKDHQGFLREFEGEDKYLGNFADAGDWGVHGVSGAFFGNGYPMSKLDKNGFISDKNSLEGISMAYQGYYRTCLDQNNDLAFCYCNPEDKKYENPSKISLVIPQKEADELIRGLFLQAMNGLGRTSFNQIRDTLEYRFSEEFEQDRREEERRA